MTDDQHESFFQGYVECALWSESINDFATRHNAKTGEDWSEDSSMLDFGFDQTDLSTDALIDMRKDCEDFIAGATSDLEDYIERLETQGLGAHAVESGAAYAGHDFWLTRNGHGAGFWDRGIGDLGDRLTAMSKPYGGANLLVGDDEQIHHC